MKIRSSFSVDAPPDRVVAYLLDVNEVVGCIPGAQLTEVVDAETFQGTLKIKVGAVQVTYQGTAHLAGMTEDEQTGLTLRIQGDGREVGGQGTVRATMAMSVSGGEAGPSTVTIDSDLTVTGRIAQFGRGIIEDVSRRLVNDMGTCIGARLQAAPAGGSA